MEGSPPGRSPRSQRRFAARHYPGAWSRGWRPGRAARGGEASADRGESVSAPVCGRLLREGPREAPDGEPGFCLSPRCARPLWEVPAVEAVDIEGEAIYQEHLRVQKGRRPRGAGLAISDDKSL